MSAGKYNLDRTFSFSFLYEWVNCLFMINLYIQVFSMGNSAHTRYRYFKIGYLPTFGKITDNDISWPWSRWSSGSRFSIHRKTILIQKQSPKLHPDREQKFSALPVYIFPKCKWSPFYRRHFEMHLYWKSVNCHQNSTEVDNGLMSTRRLVSFWTNGCVA